MKMIKRRNSGIRKTGKTSVTRTNTERTMKIFWRKNSNVFGRARSTKRETFNFGN